MDNLLEKLNKIHELSVDGIALSIITSEQELTMSMIAHLVRQVLNDMYIRFYKTHILEDLNINFMTNVIAYSLGKGNQSNELSKKFSHGASELSALCDVWLECYEAANPPQEKRYGLFAIGSKEIIAVEETYIPNTATSEDWIDLNALVADIESIGADFHLGGLKDQPELKKLYEKVKLK